jgi:hypothetical protein
MRRFFSRGGDGVKLSNLAKGARPIFCRFEDIDDTHCGDIAEDPVWQEDNYNPGREMLVIKLLSNGVPYELRARNQMVEAILAAVTNAKADDLAAGGFLSVTFTEYRGKAKVYKAVYEPQEDNRCGCADPREPIGVAALEFDTSDPGDDGTD